MSPSVLRMNEIVTMTVGDMIVSNPSMDNGENETNNREDIIPNKP